MRLPYQMFGQAQQPNRATQAVAQARQMARGNPQALFNSMMASDPRFREFVQDNAGKTPQQIAAENGIDVGQVSRAMNGGA